VSLAQAWKESGPKNQKNVGFLWGFKGHYVAKLMT
jgi:hypothetical protein